MFPSNQSWAYRLGYASGRYGEMLTRQLQPRGRGRHEARANKILENLIDKIERSPTFVTEFHCNALRFLVLNCAALYNSSLEEEKGKYCFQFAKGIKRWKDVYGDDPAVDYETSNLLLAYPEVNKKYEELI